MALKKRTKIGCIFLVMLASILVTALLIVLIPALADGISSALGFAASIWRLFAFLTCAGMALMIALIAFTFNLFMDNPVGNREGKTKFALVLEIILMIIVLIAAIIIVRYVLFLNFSIIPLLNLWIMIYIIAIWGAQFYLSVFTFGWHMFKRKRVRG